MAILVLFLGGAVILASLGLLAPAASPGGADDPVGPGGVGVPGGEPPEAYAYCMPNQGWAPLSVSFSAFESGPGIVRYRWDLDGDGLFETDATSLDGYTECLYTRPGTYTATLEVTDIHGRTSTAGVTVQVRHPASSSVDYWTVFDDSRVRRIDLSVSREDWDLMWRNPGDKIVVEAGAVVFGQSLGPVGLSMRGNFSLLNSNEKKPWKIDTDAFVSGQEYRNLRQLLLMNNLGDSSLVREKLAYDLLAASGAPASHVCFVEVWVVVRGGVGDGNWPQGAGGPAFLGVYSMVERVDMKYLSNRFGRGSKGGNLYKANHFQRGAADLVYYGEDFENYPQPHGLPIYGKMSNEEEADCSDIIDLCRVLDGQTYETPEEFASALEEVFNVDSFLRYMAVQIAIMSWDIYPNTGNNLYLYNNPSTGKFEWIAWDLTWGETPHQPLFEAGHESVRLLPRAPLYDGVFAVPRYRQDCAAYLDLLTRLWFSEAYIGNRARELQETIRPHLTRGEGDLMFLGPTAMSRLEEFEGQWRAIAELTGKRAAFIQEELRRGAYLSPETDESDEKDGGM